MKRYLFDFRIIYRILIRVQIHTFSLMILFNIERYYSIQYNNIQYRTILFHIGWKQKCYFKSMKFRELHCVLYIKGSRANCRLESLQRCYTTWTNWMFIIFRVSTLIVASKLLIFLTPSTNNSLQLFHSKHYLKLSDNSFKTVLMQ